MTRRYFRSSVHELEALLAAHRGDIRVLRDLLEELSHRRTERAAKLRSEISQYLAQSRATISPDLQSSFEFSSSPPLESRSECYSHREPADNFYDSRRQSARPFVTSENLRDNVRNEQADPLPPITNRPEQILSAWTALEVLSPPLYRKPEDLAGGDRSRVAFLSGPTLPWERGEQSRRNQRLYYQVVLGSIKMAPAIELLIERYGDTRLERPRARGNAVLATVIVDRHGYLVASPAVGVSSFGWGVISALKGELTDLAKWPAVERDLVEQIENHLLTDFVSDDQYAERRPVTRTDLFDAYEELVVTLGLPNDWLEPPAFAIRSYTYFKDPNPPEPLLLNSFFLTDLSLARTLVLEHKAPRNLRHYLGIEHPKTPRDLLNNEEALAEAISPKLTPLARWPAKGRSPLVLLQQAAVNTAFDETRKGGLLGINGPPGTGKTTLLRDLVAGVVTERATAMAEFIDPQEAFVHTGQRLRVGNAWIHLYQLDQALKGFEMVVASSNNKAVENVSAELPNCDAVADDASNLRYLKTLSDALHHCETWGTIAAVLGNAQNRNRFKQTFWWDDDCGLNAYLQVVAGSVREVEIIDPATGATQRRMPRIVEAEVPPSTPQEARERWHIARKQFLTALEKSRRWQARLEKLRTQLARLPELAKTEATTHRNYRVAIAKVEDFRKESGFVLKRESDFDDPAQQLRDHESAKPGFWARLFRTKAAQKWMELRRLLLTLQSAESAWTRARAAHEQAKQRLNEAQQKYNLVFPDSTFFKEPHKERQQATPWFPQAAQYVRDQVFIAAMALHRAFIDAAAKPLRHNLNALMNVFTTQTLPSADKQALLPDLWASLFLVVPLVSTTFASVNRMLGKMPVESIGWLFVDEAGQALPQAAVGALLRTRRAVVVGDPVQIEPVVILPDVLTSAICHRFGVEPDYYAAPNASVQTLADAASSYATEFPTPSGSRTVGVPLLVHRRCSEPMFGISNRIAYSGYMVSAKTPKPSQIRDVLGPSRWINVEGSGDDKWCPQEGEEVLRLLAQLARARTASDLYIVTPFVIVADRLRQIVRESNVLKGWIEDGWRWTHERIGTVHTVQGREAEAVFIVLGAPHPAQTGARGWAGGRPNLLNVAVTRAKEVIYVVGNRKLWREAGHFKELDKSLP